MSLVADRLRAAIEAVVRALVPPVDALALYECQVVTWDETTQTASLVPATASSVLPAAMAGVPQRVGPPGTRVVLVPGSRVLVGFTDGDLARPEIRFADLPGTTGFLPAGTRVDLAAGTQGAARVGDATDDGKFIAQTAVVAGVPVLVALWYKAPGAAAYTAVQTLPIPPLPAAAGTPVSGTVTTGSSKVRIG